MTQKIIRRSRGGRTDMVLITRSGSHTTCSPVPGEGMQARAKSELHKLPDLLSRRDIWLAMLAGSVGSSARDVYAEEYAWLQVVTKEDSTPADIEKARKAVIRARKDVLKKLDRLRKALASSLTRETGKQPCKK